MTSHSRKIAEFAANLKLSDVPPDVVRRAKGIILDGLGCGLFAAHLRWTAIIAETVAKLEPSGGKASVWGRGERVSPTSAVLVNGTAVQGYELDDGNQACFHAAAVILPAAFAAAEYMGDEQVDGEKLLTAIIAGFEIGPRIGLCMNGDEMIVKGWHAPGVFGSFPAAISAGLILGLDADRLYHALGIAGTQASGLMAAQFGSMVKRMQCAKNAQSGLYAALLAGNGLTGIADVFETKYGGFCTTFTQSEDQFDLVQLTKGFGEHWETMCIDIKRRAALGTNFSSIDAAEELVAEHNITTDQIEEIVVSATQATISHGVWHYEPTGLTAAQMHLGFGIATQIIEGRTFVDEMVEANVAREDLVALARKVRGVRDTTRESMSQRYHRGAEVEIRLKDGRAFKKTVDFFLGSHHRPLTDNQIVEKFRTLGKRTLGTAALHRIEEIIWSLETIHSVAELNAILRNDDVQATSLAKVG
jgi:aconitate decarboxylase